MLKSLRDAAPEGHHSRNYHGIWTPMSLALDPRVLVACQTVDGHRDAALDGRNPRDCRRFSTLLSCCVNSHMDSALAGGR